MDSYHLTQNCHIKASDFYDFKAIVFTALVGLESWISGKINELLLNKDDTTQPQDFSQNLDVKYKR